MTRLLSAILLGTATVTNRSPSLIGIGSLSLTGNNLIIAAPMFTGFPVPTTTLTSLTRDGVDVRNEIVSGSSIPNAPAGNYSATWVSTNGLLPNGSASATFTVGIGDFSAAVSIDGDHIRMTLPAGFTSANTTIVDRSKILITQTVPSLSSTGAEIIRTVPVPVGYTTPVIEGANLLLPINGWISSTAESIELNMEPGALVNGAVQTQAINRPAAPGNLYGDSKVKIRLAGIVPSRNELLMAFSVLDKPFRIEAMGGHASGLAGVLFKVELGAGVVEHFVSSMERSTYQDKSIITDAQWAKNLLDSGDNIRGGVGVWASPLFNPDDFDDGFATVTATGYAYAGGKMVSTTDTWQVCLNSGGTYTERVRYVDNVAGSDTTNDGLTAGTAYATINRAAFVVGSLAGGATQWSIPIIKVVGSGDPANPRTTKILASKANGNNLPKITDTWITIQPAEGHDLSDTWLNSTKADPRIRRLRLKDISIDISQGLTGTGSSAILSRNDGIYPKISNPPSVWFDGVDSFHKLGIEGHVTEGDSGYLLSTSWAGCTTFFTRYTARDMARKGHSNPSINYVRDMIITRTVGDTIKGPAGLFMSVLATDNILPPGVMKFLSVQGTIALGDTVSGVRSQGTGTVAEVYGNSSIFVNPRSGSFKLDDALRHGAVTVADASGFTIGEMVNGHKLDRRDGNILRFGQLNGASVFLPAPGTVLVGATSGATQTVISSATEENIFFSPSGARGRYAAPHPDLVQVQAFLPHRVIYTPISGEFVIGEAIRLGSTPKGNLQEMGVTIDGRFYMTVGGKNYTWFDDTIGGTINGVTSGATATFRGVYDFPGVGNRNLVIANLYAPAAEGAAFFAENGWNGGFVANLFYIGESGTRENPTQWARIADFNFMHMSVHQRPFANAIQGVLAPRSRISILGVLGETVAAGASPGIHMEDLHAADPAAPLGTTTGLLQRGDPQFVNGVGFDEDYDLARNDFTPGTTSPLRRIAPKVHGAWMPFDLFGNRRPIDGTAAIGAIEAASL